MLTRRYLYILDNAVTTYSAEEGFGAGGKQPVPPCILSVGPGTSQVRAVLQGRWDPPQGRCQQRPPLAAAAACRTSCGAAASSTRDLAAGQTGEAGSRLQRAAAPRAHGTVLNTLCLLCR
jgi:hypothetical protein